ncbi:MAG: response regulator [Cyanobacteria bacterium J06600_6]
MVDDCEDNILLMELLLHSEGYQVRCATSGIKGLVEVSYEPPDLIILDLMMPDISGLEVIRYLENKCDSANIPIILLTANSNLRLEDVSGATQLCYKPFNFECFLDKIQSTLFPQQQIDSFSLNL